MREVPLQGVGAPAPEIDVERPVYLPGVGIVVLERCIVSLTQLKVEFGQECVGIVGPADRPEIASERAAECRIYESLQRRSDLTQPVGLLGLVVLLLIIGKEEKGAV